MPLPTITGEFRCGSDLELRFSPSGTAVVTVSVIASTAKKLENGEWEETGSSGWKRCVAFGKQAEYLAEIAPAKGDKVFVAGREKENTWTTNEGEERTSMEILLTGLDILQRKGETYQQQGQQAPQQAAQPQGESPWGPGPQQGQQAPQQPLPQHDPNMPPF